MNVNPITKLWRPYNFDFVAFKTGDFPKAADGTLVFEQGPDIFPKICGISFLNVLEDKL